MICQFINRYVFCLRIGQWLHQLREPTCKRYLSHLGPLSSIGQYKLTLPTEMPCWLGVTLLHVPTCLSSYHHSSAARVTMERRAQATSILEFLTAKNPRVVQPKPASYTLTSSPLFYFPKQLKAWDEFNFETLQQIFGGDLIREARRKDRALPPYPTIIPGADCVVTDERTTTRLLAKWNETIVVSALLAVDEKFNASVWNSSVRVHEKKEVGSKHKRKGSRVQPPRKTAYRVKKPRRHSRLRPDSGAIVSSTSFELDDSATLPLSQERFQERFPKEYKTGSKWQSDALLRGDVTNSEGEWVDGHEETNYAMPIRQAFTYCIAYECRYGCILTCGEAFIFRVRPRGQPDGEIRSIKPFNC